MRMRGVHTGGRGQDGGRMQRRREGGRVPVSASSTTTTTTMGRIGEAKPSQETERKEDCIY
jgi:hypothetical protein